MKFTLEILMDNAAFGDPGQEPGTEVAGILDGVVDLVYGSYFSQGDSQVLRDSNGNTVGLWRVTK